MEKGTHGSRELAFKELSYVDQSRVLNAQILGIEKGLNAHLRRSHSEGRDSSDTKDRYIQQLERLIKGLK